MALESVTKTESEQETHETYESVPFRMHPRVFNALGVNLVTDDVVAVIELIKNSLTLSLRTSGSNSLKTQVKGPFSKSRMTVWE